MSTFERCIQEKTNCFAYKDGKCGCLNDTKFKKDCPFFKSREQHEEELRIYPNKYK